MSLLNDLQWRYATKKMNGEIVPQEKLDYILEAARLAPTSSGLQPFEILVITNKEILGKILPIAHGQSQVTEAFNCNFGVNPKFQYFCKLSEK